MMSLSSEREYSGQTAVAGIAIGRSCRLAEAMAGSRVQGPAHLEAAVLDKAISEAARELAELCDASDELGREILELQAALLEDEELIRRVRQEIASGKSAEAAWDAVIGAEISAMTGEDPGAAPSRASDYRDLQRRVRLRMNGKEDNAQELPKDAILFAEDITPSRFLGFDHGRIAGIVLSGGSATSHVAILAGSYDIPMVVGVLPEPVLAGGEMVAIDAGAGQVVVSPGEEKQSLFRRRLQDHWKLNALASRIVTKPARTATGRAVRVLLNVNHPDELEFLDPEICDGIGLVRTEFLFSESAPAEQHQTDAYSRLLAWAKGRPVTIRTLDAGGDKPIPGITRDGETNPFLGLRGLRLSLRRPKVFRTQLRALLRAAALGPLKIMLPMVTLPQELVATRKLIEEVARELGAQGAEHAVPPIGMMVEVPAAALTAADFDADFYSIGSNDLTQYVMAVARDAAGLSHLSRGDHPAVLELIGRTIAAGKNRGVEVSLCGDLASRPEVVAKLLDAGLDTFSVAPRAVARVKLEISNHGTRGAA